MGIKRGLWLTCCCVMVAGLSPTEGEADAGVCVEYDATRAYACRRNLEQVVHDMKQSGLPFDARLNKTCSAWLSTQSCLERLIDKCRSQPKHAQEYNRTLAQLRVYSRPCFDTNIKAREQQIDCYLPYMPHVHRCMDDFDQAYYGHVLERHHDKACRAVEDIMTCYLDVSNKIDRNCGSTGKREFDRDSIEPLVGEIGPFVSHNCPRSPPLEKHFSFSEPQSAGVQQPQGLSFTLALTLTLVNAGYLLYT